MRFSMILPLLCAAGLAQGASGLADLPLREGGTSHGFTCRHLFLDSRGETVGACWVHGSGFTLDLLPMRTAPQAFIWVSTPVVGHGGEPHTLEHLLLGKGKRGLSVANAEEYRMSRSGAFTGQLETCYHFSTALGVEAFVEEFGDRLDALLHPDFSDEEIRREVCHMGWKEGAEGIELEEKGTVYTEMLSSWDHPWSRASVGILEALHGAGHPQAAYQGGTPEGIRGLTPARVRDFQRRTHFLANMGAEMILPPDTDGEELLEELDALLRRLEPVPPAWTPLGREQLPERRPTLEPLLEIVDVPDAREGAPALLIAAWPARAPLGQSDRRFVNLFLDVAANGESSELWGVLMDPVRSQDPLGASGMGSWLDSDPGDVIWLAIEGLPASRVTPAGLQDIRKRINDFMGEIARLPAGDARLEALRQRALASLAASRRAGRSLLDRPPGFGQRSTGSGWSEHLRELRASGEFRLRLDEGPALDEVDRRLNAPGNPFSGLLATLDLAGTPPHLAATRSVPKLLEEKEASRRARLDVFADSLQRAYAVPTRQEALLRFRDEYEQVSAHLEAGRAGLPEPPLPASFPPDSDPSLQLRLSELVPGIPLAHGIFESMQGASFTLAYDLSPLAAWPWLPALPALLGEAGLRGPAGVLDFRQVEDALRREVSQAGCELDVDLDGGRAELLFSTAGSDPGECARGVDWLLRFRREADWSEANRPRLREIVRRELANTRQRRQNAEESWVDVPAAAWSRREQAVLLRAGCFLTMEHDLFRCAWALEAQTPAFTRLLGALAAWPARPGATPDSCRAWLRSLAQAAPEGRAQALTQLGPAGSDPLAEPDADLLAILLGDMEAFAAELPAETFAEDWSLLLDEVRQAPALLGELRLERLDALGEARAWFTGSPAAWKDVAPAARRLAEQPSGGRPLAGHPTRLAGRATDGVCVGLLEPGLESGVAILTAPLAWQGSWTRDDLLDHLASNLLGGGGDQGLFMQTWAAGLAYSNGIGPSGRTGLLRYYAERCPDAAQTLGFVEDRVRQAPQVDARRARSAVVTAVGGSLAALPYSQRTRQRALDVQTCDRRLPDGLSVQPAKGGRTRLDDQRAFRQGLLQFLQDPDLPAELEARKLPVHAHVLPGLAPNGWKPMPGTQFFLIGAERQFELVDRYLDSRAPGQRLVRLHPRDYWLVDTRGAGR